MLTRDEVRDLRTNLQTALASVSAAVGFKLTLGSATFGDTVTFKLECAPIAENGKVVDQNEVNFKRWASAYGLKETDLGRSFHSNGWVFTLVGIDPRKPKFPILARRTDGKTFKFQPQQVQRSLNQIPSVEVR